MSNFSDNLPVCYVYAVIFVCRFAKGFVLPLQRLVLYVILLPNFPLIIVLNFTFTLFRSSIYLVGQCSTFLRGFLFLCKYIV